MGFAGVCPGPVLDFRRSDTSRIRSDLVASPALVCTPPDLPPRTRLPRQRAGGAGRLGGSGVTGGPGSLGGDGSKAGAPRGQALPTCP